MAKHKKKRNKKYTGADAKTTQPTNIIKVNAVRRSPAGQWWHEKKKIVKTISITAAVVIFIVWLLYTLLGLIFNW